MKVTPFTRSALAYRRDQRRMVSAGWSRSHDLDWRLHRGELMDHVISEVRIAADGKEVWYRLEKRGLGPQG
jgi:hypothetical protein